MTGLLNALIAGAAAGAIWSAVTVVLQRRRERRSDARWTAFMADVRGAGQQARARNRAAS